MPINNSLELKSKLKKGASLQEILGIEDDALAAFYETAYSLYVNKEYEKAADGFFFLTSLSPERYPLWFGLGLAEYELRHYDEALEAFHMAVLLDMDNPLPYYHMARIYRDLKDRTNGMNSIEIAFQLGSGTMLHSFELLKYELALLPA
jgi:type III secretion system low calcium response chaperone LcrH/SycD